MPGGITSVAWPLIDMVMDCAMQREPWEHQIYTTPTSSGDWLSHTVQEGKLQRWRGAAARCFNERPSSSSMTAREIKSRLFDLTTTAFSLAWVCI